MSEQQIIQVRRGGDSMIFNLDTVPLPSPEITVRTCDRSPRSFDTIRKFKAECGTYFEVALTRHGKMRSIKADYNCSKGCLKCEVQLKKIREIIAAGR